MIEENCNTCEHGENTDVCPLGKCAWSPNYTYKEGRRAGIEEAIASVHTARQFPVSGQPAAHVFDVVEAIRALLEAK